MKPEPRPSPGPGMRSGASGMKRRKNSSSGSSGGWPGCPCAPRPLRPASRLVITFTTAGPCCFMSEVKSGRLRVVCAGVAVVKAVNRTMRASGLMVRPALQASRLRERRHAAALDVDPAQQKQPDHEIEAGDEDAEAVVAGEDKRDRAIGEWAEDRSRLHCQPPKPEELRQARWRREVADECPARCLGRSHAEPGKVRGKPE